MATVEAILDRGMGDALCTRAFLFEYCRQKNIQHSEITIYTERHKILFENDSFIIKDMKQAPDNLVWYGSFAKFNFTKVYRNPIQRDLAISYNSGIKFNWQHKEPLNWNRPNISNLNLPKKFITVNYGYDAIADSNEVCAKMWPIEYWTKLIQYIGIPCVQIGGGKNTKVLPGTKLNFLNKLTIKESAEVMKKALFHIDTEGGLTILNHHLGGKTVVLFGPTAIQTFAFKENLNISYNTCENSPCDPRQIRGGKIRIYQNKNALQCDLRCMQELKPEYVINKIKKVGWL